jgi:hypothetical protein
MIARAKPHAPRDFCPADVGPGSSLLVPSDWRTRQKNPHKRTESLQRGEWAVSANLRHRWLMRRAGETPGSRRWRVEKVCRRMFGAFAIFGQRSPEFAEYPMG